jgi:hypothetical protein
MSHPGLDRVGVFNFIACVIYFFRLVYPQCPKGSIREGQKKKREVCEKIYFFSFFSSVFLLLKFLDYQRVPNQTRG